MVSPRETDILFYQDTLAWAERTGQEGLVTTLKEIGPPPYDELLDYEPAISHEHDWNAYPGFDPSTEMPLNLMVPENTLMDRINGMRAFLDTFSVLYPQIQDVDLRRRARELETPTYIVLGEYEARGRAVLAREWFRLLEAPSKELIIVENTGHRPLFEKPVAFAALMSRILERTSQND
jgi:pimeloyl-ACP methyl ester carboxylesterase